MNAEQHPASSTGRTGSVKLHLLDQATRLLGRGGRDALTIPAAADLAGITVDEAKTLFSSDEDLYSEVSAFLDERLRGFVDQELTKLPADASVTQKLRANATGYFNQALDNPTYFAAYSRSKVAHQFPSFEAQVDNAPDLGAFPPATTRIIRLLVELTEEMGMPVDKALILRETMAVLSEIHGLAHLATFGIMRHLSPTAKRQTFQAALQTLLSGLADTIKEGHILAFEPEHIKGELLEPFTTKAKDMPRGTRDEAREALFRGAAEVVIARSVDGMTLEAAAEQADLPVSTARQLFDGDAALLRELEVHLDEANTQTILRQSSFVSEGSPGLTYIKATGFGYLQYALTDPVGFVALIEIASRSIVPVSFDDEGGTAQPFDMGKAFTFLMNIVRDAISQSDGPRSTWVLYTQMMALWASIHGVSQLATIGVLAYDNQDFCYRITSRVMDILLRGMINVLELRPQ
ncbi:TetR/AcrR family transcriptional regulator [Corynebacterium hadale]|uniref:TetR/AcrR family transcriptional regulator n=1 Tax=Corynebacterium hadale TaxID=2026255 RepID=UPI000BAA5A35|nr:WHG domain-containing protein [Corynebacterium hadale]PAT06958.1 hypothetical protein CKJ82_10650 [Corynebacterium hadale]